MRCNCMKILAAIFSRLLFAIHGSIMVSLMVILKDNELYWIFITGILLLFVEMIVTLTITKHGEWKWFSPMVFLYLCTVVPSIFVMELTYLEVRMNNTNLTNDCNENDVTITSKLVQGGEELTILILIVGRWLMPRGKMNREQLAQLLLMYLALGADMLDILELIKEPSVTTNKNITLVGLCLFSWAIMQFTIVLTQTLSPSSSDTTVKDFKNCLMSIGKSDEMWSVIFAVGFQDGPFLVYRLYLVTQEGVFNESMTFFISKNILSVVIQLYRAITFMCNENRKRKKFKQSQMNLE